PVARRPEREDGALAVARVDDAPHPDAADRRADGGLHRVGAEAGDHDRVAHPGLAEIVDQAHEEALAADLDQALRAAAGGGEEPLADARGEDDRRHRARTSSRA